MTSFCRLFVYLAREAPVGVVLRRGPSEWARLSVWHTDNDTFEHGQWIKGRIYERRSDVSADGSLFAAFVRKSGWRSAHPKSADTWLAISRPPYFTALALWFIGGTYHTGGFFPERSSIWTGFMEHPPDIGSLPDWLNVTAPRDIPYIDRTADWTDRTVHFNRLLRDGWNLTEAAEAETNWERRNLKDNMTLKMSHRFDTFQRPGGPYVVTFQIRKEQDGSEIELGEAAWADWDQHGRLVLARDGCLHVWDPASGLRVIEDFNGQNPTPEPGPDWALHWPSQSGDNARP
jgi:hypothetical protein